MVRPPFSMGRRGAVKLDATFELAMQIGSVEVGASVRPPPGLESSIVSTERAKFFGPGVKGFDPVPWLPVLERGLLLGTEVVAVAETGE